MGRLYDAAADLLLGGRCCGCGRAGRLVCPECATVLRPSPRLAWPDPVPPSLRSPVEVTPVAAGAYDGPLRAALVEFKEERRLGLLSTLSPMLSTSVTASLEIAARDDAAAALVPMPSRRRAVRERGYDAVALLAARTARDLRRAGRDVVVARALRHRFAVRDQAGLSAEQRTRNLAGALRAVPGTLGHRRVVVIDDVITTGASLAAAVQALRAAGSEPAAIAVVAATPRRGRAGA